MSDTGKGIIHQVGNCMQIIFGGSHMEGTTRHDLIIFMVVVVVVVGVAAAAAAAAGVAASLVVVDIV
jgi:hypothetical protein